MPDGELDRDLQSIHEARQLARSARDAQREIEGYGQDRIDSIVAAMAAAGLRESERLARSACEETGFGNVSDKVRKNNFVLEDVVAAIRGMRTVGVLREDRTRGVFEIAEPVGVVAGIIPSTNPTSTAMFKCLIAVKARCGIVLSPHPSAKGCINESAEVMHRAAIEAGAPSGIIGCMRLVTGDGTRELMNGPDTDLILATGGIGLVKAAYSAGKPAYGVGPGNVPAYIERSADVGKAVRDIVAGTTFDNGTLCSSEQSIICDRVIGEKVRAEVVANGGHFLSAEENQRLAQVLISEDLLVNPELVGRPASSIAAAAGIEVPEGTRVLICPLDGVGKPHPLSREKLSPVLAFYEVEDWQEGCARCMELLAFGGLGHTLAIHSQNQEVILEFGLRKPAHRVLVNTVAALGAVGYTTSLFPSMTLGCGAWGNNITSDNIGPQHLLNVKRLAFETRALEGTAEPAASPAPAATPEREAAAGVEAGSALEVAVTRFLTDKGVLGPSPTPQPQPPVAPERTPQPPRARSLQPSPPATASTTEKPASPSPSSVPGSTSPSPPRAAQSPSPSPAPSNPATPAPAAAPASPPAEEFVGESDVRAALARGEKITIGPDTIITPLARELGEERGVFRQQ